MSRRLGALLRRVLLAYSVLVGRRGVDRDGDLDKDVVGFTTDDDKTGAW